MVTCCRHDEYHDYTFEGRRHGFQKSLTLSMKPSFLESYSSFEKGNRGKETVTTNNKRPERLNDPTAQFTLYGTPRVLLLHILTQHLPFLSEIKMKKDKFGRVASALLITGCWTESNQLLQCANQTVVKRGLEPPLGQPGVRTFRLKLGYSPLDATEGGLW